MQAADVVMTDLVGTHGDAFWREEFPLMVARSDDEASSCLLAGRALLGLDDREAGPVRL